MAITINVGKAKDVAHDMRRQDRAARMAPLDVKATIPAEAAEAEASRQAIREHNAKVQVAIDDATSEQQLVEALDMLKQETKPASRLKAVNE